MVKVKSIEEWVGNYYISTGLGMWESVRCWMDKGFDRKAAIDKALDYGRNAVKDVENREELGLFFKDIASAYDSLGELLLKKAH